VQKTSLSERVFILEDAPRPNNRYVPTHFGEEEEVTLDSSNDSNNKTKNTDSGDGVAQGRITRVTHEEGRVTPENTCKTQENEEGVTLSYPESDMTLREKTNSDSYQKQGNESNLGNLPSDCEDDVTPHEETPKTRKLIRYTMIPKDKMGKKPTEEEPADNPQEDLLQDFRARREEVKRSNSEDGG